MEHKWEEQTMLPIEKGGGVQVVQGGNRQVKRQGVTESQSKYRDLKMRFASINR